MGKIVAVSNHKGGVGKTTSTVNIGAGLARPQLNKRVLLIDLDPQANLSQSLGLQDKERSIYGALKGKHALEPIKVTDLLHVIPSTLDLSGAEIELSSETGREYILKDLIEPLKGRYDYIFIDCPPSLGLLTINALTAADQIFIPLQTEYLALQGLTKLIEVVDKIKLRLNKKLRLGGVILTQFDARKTLNRDVAAAIEAHFKKTVFKTRIRDNVSLAEAPSKGMTIFNYAASSKGAKDYCELSREVASRL